VRVYSSASRAGRLQRVGGGVDSEPSLQPAETRGASRIELPARHFHFTAGTGGEVRAPTSDADF